MSCCAKLIQNDSCKSEDDHLAKLECWICRINGGKLTDQCGILAGRHLVVDLSTIDLQ